MPENKIILNDDLRDYSIDEELDGMKGIIDWFTLGIGSF